MMKHTWIFMIVLAFGVSMAFGQRRPRLAQLNNERIESMRIAHYSNQMSLSSGDAQTFWPWFNEREAKLKKARTQKNLKQKQMQRAMAENDEKVIENILDEYVELKFREAQIERNYHKKLVELLPIRKVVLFYKAEREWEIKIIKFLQQRRNDE